MLHVLRVMTDSEFLNKWEDIEVIWKQVLLLVRVITFLAIVRVVIIQSAEAVANLQLGDEMGLLKIRSEVTVF